MNADFAARHWYRRSVLSIVLFPFSVVFGALVALRRMLYRSGALVSVRLPVPVIVVGNLTVGGTGKTPLVIALVRALAELGHAPGIVCRGYGGDASRSHAAPRPARPGGASQEVGDEALLLAERTGCPVWVARDRAAAASALLAADPRCDLIVCDDGLQHYRLQRDVEIAVEDQRGHGNGLMLPAGPLREPAGRPVDALVINCDPAGGGNENTPAHHRPSRHAGAPAVFRMRLVPAGLFRVGSNAGPVDPAELAGKRIHAVAGIGNPQRFFLTLEALGLSFTRHPFPDHHRFAPDDLRLPACDVIVMTEKDAVKCRTFARDDLVALRVEAVIDASFIQTLRTWIHGRAPARYSGLSDLQRPAGLSQKREGTRLPAGSPRLSDP